MSLVVLSTHPIQYQAPVYRLLQADFGVPVTAVYGSDFSVVGYHDREFNAEFAWDTDLLSGYTPLFVSRVADGGASSLETVSARGLGQVVAGLEPRAILLTGYRPRFDLGAYWIARRAGCPLLFRAETTDHAIDRRPAKAWLRDQFLRAFYRPFARLLYVGRHSLAHYRRLGVPEERLVFSPYCVDTTPFQLAEPDRDRLRQETRQAWNLAAGQKVVVFVGKLVERKGPDLLLLAAKRLDPSVRDRLTLLFVGDGDLRDSLRQAAADYPQLDARFLGFQAQHALSRCYHASDLLAMPSRRGETWGLVVNEALHHGLPCVVSSRVGCAPDLIQAGSTGEICDPDSVDSLALALERALSYCDRADARARCQERVAGYTLQQAADGIARAYRAITGERGGERES